MEHSHLSVQSPALKLELTSAGKVAGITLGNKNIRCNLRCETVLSNCILQDSITTREMDTGAVEFSGIYIDTQGNSCKRIERFIPTDSSVRWELDIIGLTDPWSTAISTRLQWPATSHTRFWTAWSDPQPADEWKWRDPLIPSPMVNMALPYGGAYESNKRFITLPIVTFIESDQEVGLSLVMSPEDMTLDAMLTATADGEVLFSRTHNRISGMTPIHFSMDIVGHQADFRDGLGWMVRRYPEYFEPADSKVHEIAGGGAYSFYEGELDVARLKEIGFHVNWKASFDFPYMGMFLPPVEDDEIWMPFQKRTSMSITAMADYSMRMKQAGFHVLNYFNCNEVGIGITWPPPERKAVTDSDLWKDANDFVYYGMETARLQNEDGSPIYSWEKCVVMDPGDDTYRKHLLEQARLHIRKLPDSSGICIDRLDWMALYNSSADDSVSWVDGQASRSLLISWRKLLIEICAIMHSVGKVVFVNPVYKRIDAMRDVDGIYDEHGQYGMNASTFMALSRPMIAWIASEDDLRPDPDAFLQRHLYMGAFLMTPFPDNDHSITPSDFAEPYYRDYAPLLEELRGRKWVLVPHVVEVVDGVAKANVFRVSDSYRVSVVFGDKVEQARVVLRNLPDLLDEGIRLIAEVRHPGKDRWLSIPALSGNGCVTIDVPLERGCAMIRVSGESQLQG